jgi:MFS family permease
MKINRVIRTLVLADFFVNAGFSVFGPVVAIFITKQIAGGTIEAIGFGAALVQICKVIVEFPLARYLDRNHGEYDDFYSLIFGSVLIAIVPFAYLWASSITHIYFIQALYGVGIAFVIPPWYAIFSRHLDKMHESFEWTLDSISIGLAAAGAAALGGIIAQRFGFEAVFVLGGIFAVLGGLMQIFIFKDLKKKVPQGQVKPEPDKAT